MNRHHDLWEGTPPVLPSIVVTDKTGHHKVIYLVRHRCNVHCSAHIKKEIPAGGNSASNTTIGVNDLFGIHKCAISWVLGPHFIDLACSVTITALAKRLGPPGRTAFALKVMTGGGGEGGEAAGDCIHPLPNPVVRSSMAGEQTRP